jgi:guanylate kinase
MPTRKTTKTGARKAARKASRSAGDVLRETWEAALSSLSAAETELEKQVRSMMKGKGLGADAAESVRQLGHRLQKERRKLAREIETRMTSLQARMKKERKTLTRLVDDAVRGALAAINIPSRQEINDLTRKVDELTRKIDGFAVRPTRRVARKHRVPAAHA